jgi:hypothetical protein
MTETATIEIPVYRTPEGRHTCAGKRITDTCPFLKWGRYRSQLDYFCNRTQQQLVELSDGYLRPCSGCPIKQEVQP